MEECQAKISHTKQGKAGKKAKNATVLYYSNHQLSRQKVSLDDLVH
jgi:hypothetical protein